MRRVALLGWYGRGNFGNGAIREGIEHTFRTIDERIVVEAYALAYGDATATPLDPRGANGVVDLFSDQDVAALNERFDLVVFGGGRLETLFRPLIRSRRGSVPRRVSRDLETRILAQLDNIKVAKILHSVSFGGGPIAVLDSRVDAVIDDVTAQYRSAHAELLSLVTADLLPRFGAASVRGRISRHLLADANPIVVADPALCLPAPKHTAPDVGRRTVAVCMKGDAEADVIEHMARFLDPLAAEGWAVVLVPMCSRLDEGRHSDVTVSLAVAGRMRARRHVSVWAPNHASPSELVTVLAAMDLVVSMRLHGAILAAMAGCVVIPVLTAELKMLEVLDMMGIASNAVYSRELSSEQLAARAASSLRRMDDEVMAGYRHRHRDYLRAALPT